MDSNEQGTPSSDRSRSTPPVDGYSVVAFHENQRAEVVEQQTVALTSGGGKPGQGYPMIGPSSTRTSPPTTQHEEAQTLFAVDSPAKISRWLDGVLAWLESDQGYGSSSAVSLMRSLPVGFSSRTSLACFPPTTDETWQSCFVGWKNSGMGGPTGCLTLATSEWHNDAAECSLSDMLETQPVPQKFFLSARAAKGILKRAAKRERALPAALSQALSTLAATTEDSKPNPESI